MKKILCIALTALTVATCCATVGCSGGDANVNYTLSDDGTYYTLSSVSGNLNALTEYVIPSEYSEEEGGKKLPVTAIADQAFYQCSSLYSVVIPDSVKSIGNLAFALTGLTEIDIPDSVKTIGYSAFGMCKELTTVVVPSSVTSLGDRAFMGCSKLERAEIYANITDLKYYTFYNSVASTGGNVYTNTSLTQVVLPSTLTKIEHTAFYGNLLSDLFFFGTKEQWDKVYFYDLVKKEGTQAEYEEKVVEKDSIVSKQIVCFYSQTEPTKKADGSGYEGNFWHYGEDGTTPVRWEIK